MRVTLYVLFVLFVSMPAGGFAACTMESGSNSAHLVELYTSEGCDSCPPAERWMSSLLGKPNLIGLEFHVDYWNTSDWRDPFAQHAFSERQRRIAQQGSHGQIYTPQIWIDGRLWQNWPKGAPPSPASVNAPLLKIQVTGNNPIGVTLDATPLVNSTSVAAYKLYVALTENGLDEYVRGGENHGKHLQHDEVVRALVGPLDSSHAQVRFDPPTDFKRAHASVVAFAQDPAYGAIVQALRAPLDSCEP